MPIESGRDFEAAPAHAAQLWHVCAQPHVMHEGTKVPGKYASSQHAAHYLAPFHWALTALLKLDCAVAHLVPYSQLSEPYQRPFRAAF